MRSVLPLLLSFVGACVVDSAASESPLTCPGEEADACLGLGPQAEPAVSELARTSVQGTPLAACSTEPMTGSEDFARFLAHVPGCFSFIGNGEASAPLHSPDYDFNDAALVHGAAVHVATVRRRLPAE